MSGRSSLINGSTLKSEGSCSQKTLGNSKYEFVGCIQVNVDTSLCFKLVKVHGTNDKNVNSLIQKQMVHGDRV